MYICFYTLTYAVCIQSTLRCLVIGSTDFISRCLESIIKMKPIKQDSVVFYLFKEKIGSFKMHCLYGMIEG